MAIRRLTVRPFCHMLHVMSSNQPARGCECVAGGAIVLVVHSHVSIGTKHANRNASNVIVICAGSPGESAQQESGQRWHPHRG